MKYRKLDTNGDMVLGHGNADYLHNVPEAVAQAVLTRLRLLRGEWFLDVTEGTPYSPAILGKHTAQSYDFAIRQRVLETEGVTEIVSYESRLDGETRGLSITMCINTVYGPATVQEIL
ncbi:hypothetical protein [Desulfovibrio cuneatus]|uniref:hypothetical protein n=1 Tax=Desulfovibrio cuneatus TaxID=159728 RepID=UPI0004048F6D|nr:hypothetical protein [Desulfovibrio cuneatus]